MPLYLSILPTASGNVARRCVVYSSRQTIDTGTEQVPVFIEAAIRMESLTAYWLTATTSADRPQRQPLHAVPNQPATSKTAPASAANKDDAAPLRGW